jgi:predicted Kef-type K+ transport protein
VGGGERIGLKGDSGVLVFGMLVATHPKAHEPPADQLGFKDLFSVGVFPEQWTTASFRKPA